MAPDALNVAIRWYDPDTGTRLDCDSGRRTQTVKSGVATGAYGDEVGSNTAARCGFSPLFF